MVKFQIRSEGCRAVSVGSPIRFFDPILNNALALRASQNAYLLAKIGADTAENEQHFAENLPKIGNYPTGPARNPIWAER